ncbi:MAG: hypothetical protein A2156_08785 [Deltaproteobacteria bacterium RBG_16_48_10]|nr:MAG: hypothetical protein A2156_08785 [Deltaproteobacteria bacterium RBG_16_48_10]
MKKYIRAFGIIILIGVVAYSSFSNGKTKTIKAGGILSVNDIQSDPLAYKGTITITGVVAGVTRSDPTVFAIIDTAEAIACKSTGCARFYLHVRYEGSIPKQWDEVNVTGSFTQSGRFPVFAATKVDVLRNYFGGK